jgi:RND family efflux transporter MFP subunit
MSSTEVDIRELAIARETAPPATLRRRRHIVSRYIVPGALIAGFTALVAWAARDRLSPRQEVWVVPVLASQSLTQSEGTPLFDAAGWIEPRPTPIRVAALAPGVVEKLLVVEDQPVKAGEPVAELVKQDAQLEYERAEANLKLSQAQLREMQAALQGANTRLNQPVHLEAALGEAEAMLAQIATDQTNLPFELRRAEAQLKFAKNDYEGKLASKGALAERAINEAKNAQDAAAALVEELRGRSYSLGEQNAALAQRRDALKKQLELLADETEAKESAEAKLQAAAAGVEQAKVAVAQAKLRLDRMTVRAPVDGRVYELLGFPGTTLTAGMSASGGTDASTVVTLYRPDMLQVRVDVRFQEIPKVSLGQTVRINNPALKEPLAGRVLFVSSVANIQKNTLGVKVAIDSPPPVFKPEMLVDVTFLAPKPAGEASAAEQVTRLYVPQQSVQKDETGAYVWLADQSAGVAKKAAVTPGQAINGGLVEISGDVTMASRVIARGHEGLSDGKRIRVMGEEVAAANIQAASTTEPHTSMSRLPQEN